MKVSKSTIDGFLGQKKFAIAGVSTDQKKFGYVIYKELREKGYDVYPINPNADTIDGNPCYRSISALPDDVKQLVVVVKKTKTMDVLKEARDKGIQDIWLQQMSETPEAVAFATENFNSVVAKKCMMMFADPVVSMHKFHKTIMKIFGMLPK
jgi:predicted CoA-binding protein